MKYEITNKQTGEVKYVTADQLANYGLSAPSSSQQTTEPKEEKNTAQKLSDFFAPASRKFGELLGGSALMGKQNKANEQLLEQLKIRHQSLLDEAARETDSRRKAETLKMAKDTVNRMNELGGETQEMVKGIEERSGYDPNRSAVSNYLKQAAGVGAEVGTYVAPTGKNLAGKAGMGAIEGALTGVSEMDNWGEAQKIINGALGGAIMTGSLDLVGKGLGKVWKTFTKTWPEASFARGLDVKNQSEIKKAYKVLNQMSEDGFKGSYKDSIKYLRTLGEGAEEVLQKKQGSYSARKLLGNVDDEVLDDTLNELADIAGDIKVSKAIKPDSTSVFKGANGEKALESLSKLKMGEEIDLQEALNLKRVAQTASSWSKDSSKQMFDRFGNISKKIGQTLKNSDDEIKRALELEQISTVLGPLADAASAKTFKNALPTILEWSALIGSGFAVATGNYGYGGVAGTAFALNRALSGNKAVGTYNFGRNVEGKLDNQAVKQLRNFLWRTSAREGAKLANE